MSDPGMHIEKAAAAARDPEPYLWWLLKGVVPHALFRLKHRGHYVFCPAHRKRPHGPFHPTEVWCTTCDETRRIR